MVPEGWKVHSLDHVTAKTISYGIVQTGDRVSQGIPCVRVVDLTKPVMSLDEMITTTEAINKSYKKTILETGEIMLALRGEIGLVRVVPDELKGCNVTRGIARIAADPTKVSSEYLLWAMRSAPFRAQLLRRVNGSALREIPLKELRQLRVPVPPLAEQRLIAEILSTWDRAIKTVERLIDNSESQKKALMQQLLTGKNRLSGFHGECPTVALTDIVRIETGSSNREDSSEEGEFTFFDRSTDIRRSDRFLFDTEAIILGGEGQDFIPKYFAGKFDLHQRAYALFDFDNAVGKYVFYSIHFNRHLLKRFAVGSTVASLRMGTFEKLPVWLPSLPEQRAITSVLSNCDADIAAHSSLFHALKEEKRALMQQLLTGKRRVKLKRSEEAAA
jgi:type I restriction enzyme S subunit